MSKLLAFCQISNVTGTQKLKIKMHHTKHRI